MDSHAGAGHDVEREVGSEEDVDESMDQLFDMIAALRMTFAGAQSAAASAPSCDVPGTASDSVVYHADGTRCFGCNQDGRGVRCPYLSVNQDGSYVCTATGHVYGQLHKDDGSGRFSSAHASENGDRMKNQAPVRRFAATNPSNSLLASERAFWLSEAARHEELARQEATRRQCEANGENEGEEAGREAGGGDVDADDCEGERDSEERHAHDAPQGKKRARRRPNANATTPHIGFRRKEQLMLDASQMFRDLVDLGRTMHARISKSEAGPSREASCTQRETTVDVQTSAAAARATQAVRGRTHLHCYEAHLVTGLHKYAKQCSGSNTMPCLNEVCNKLYLIRREVQRTHEGAALSRKCASHSWWFVHLCEAVARLCVVLWSSAQETPHFRDGARKQENFRQFCVGVFYSFKRGFADGDLSLVPLCSDLGNVLPNFRSPRDKGSKHHGNFRISHHRGIRMLHDAYGSVAHTERGIFWRDAMEAAAHVKRVYDLRDRHT